MTGVEGGPASGTGVARRPFAARLAALLFALAGAGMVGTSFVDLVGVAAVTLAPPPDPVTFGVRLVLAVVAALLVLAGIAIGVLEIVVGLRIWRRVGWAWLEALAVGALGLAAALIGLVHPPEADAPQLARALHAPWWVASIVALLVAIGATVVARPWFGPLRWPRTDAEAPFWLRRDRFP